jgi:iron complex transport system ATP-binding protein
MLTLRNLSVSRGGRPVLHDVDLMIQSGEVLGIVGPNGAGKSTLMRAAAGLTPPTAGTATLDSEPIAAWSRAALARRIAYLPQNADCHWPMTVERVVALGRLPHLTPWQGPTAADAQAIGRAMAMAQVRDLSDRRIDKLSGGEKARVLLARALAGDPALLLADEPVSDLDPYHRLDVMSHLRRLADGGMAIAVVLHDLSLAMQFCDRLALIDKGRIVADGPPDTTLSPERLSDVFRITALRGDRDGHPYLLPWTHDTAEPRGRR